MNGKILVTGSLGLVGSALSKALRSKNFEVVGLDIRGVGTEKGDVRNREHVRAAMAGCEGIVHLAAVSRVVWGERDPDLCRATNVDGLKNVLESAQEQKRTPWVIFASSREVYGQPDRLPATEDTSLRPLNVYARSKVEGEQLIAAARRKGLRAAVVRLSNVFGSTNDHADRVVPAFAHGALAGNALRVDGSGHTFDFTHIEDVTRGIFALVDLLRNGAEAPPPIHLVTGQATTLGELASMAVSIAASRSMITLAPPRSYDVARFYGSPERAGRLLGWAPQVSLQEGLTRLIRDFGSVIHAGEAHKS